MATSLSSKFIELAENKGKDIVLKKHIVRINYQDFYDLRNGRFLRYDDPSQMLAWMLEDYDGSWTQAHQEPSIASDIGCYRGDETVYAGFGFSKTERAYENGNSKIELVLANNLADLETGYNKEMMDDFYFYVIFDIRKNRFVKTLTDDGSNLGSEIKRMSWNQVINHLQKLSHYPLGIMDELPRKKTVQLNAQRMPLHQAALF